MLIMILVIIHPDRREFDSSLISVALCRHYCPLSPRDYVSLKLGTGIAFNTMVACREVWRQVSPWSMSFWFASDTEMGVAVMLMETFDQLSRKDKYVWDVSDVVEIFLSGDIIEHYSQIYGHVRL